MALALLVLLALAVRYAEPVRDGDLFWQMAYGRYLLEHRTLIPDHSAFTWTPAANTTVYCAWIPEILLHLLHQAGGLVPLFALRYLCMLVFCLAVGYAAQRRGVLTHPLTAWVCLLGLLMARTAAFIKPEILSFVFTTLTVATWIHLKQAGEAAWRRVYLLPVIMLVWVNCHGGFVLGIGLLGLIAGGEWLNARLSPGIALAPRVRRHLFYALGLSLIAVFLTPYGWRYPAHLLHALPAKEIGELRTVRAYLSILDPRVAHYHYLPLLALAALTLLGAALPLRRRRIDWALLATNLVFAVIYTRLLRTTYFWVPVFALSAVHLAGQGAARGEAARRSRASRLRALLARPLLARAALALGTLLLAGLACYESICRPSSGRWCGFGVAYLNPVGEAAYIREHLASYRLGNTYGAGGYLLWALAPETPVMIDPRSFPFQSWYAHYREFSNGIDPARFLATYPCEVICVSHEAQRLVNWLLRNPDWTLAHYGPSAAVFVTHGVDFPHTARRASTALAGIRSLSQAHLVLRMSLALREWETAETLVARMRALVRCPHQRRQADAATDLLAGTRAFFERDYAEAVRRLEACRQTNLVQNNTLLVRSYHQLTRAAWTRGADQAARGAARAALAVAGRDAISLYNAGVIEWYLQRAGSGARGGFDSRGNWRHLLQTFLASAESSGADPGEEPAAARRALAPIARRILAGEFTGRPPLVPPHQPGAP